MGNKSEGLRMEGSRIFLPDISSQRKHAIDPSNENPTLDQIRRDLREDAELTISAVIDDLEDMRGLGDLAEVVVGGPDCETAHAEIWRRLSSGKRQAPNA